MLAGLRKLRRPSINRDANTSHTKRGVTTRDNLSRLKVMYLLMGQDTGTFEGANSNSIYESSCFSSHL
jgi:hypothetical protein